MVTLQHKEDAMLKAIKNLCEQGNTSSPDVVYKLQLEMDSIFIREDDEVVVKDYPLLYYLLLFMFRKGDAMFESTIKLVDNYLKDIRLEKENHSAMMVQQIWMYLGYLLSTLKEESWKQLVDVIFSHPSAKEGLIHNDNGFNLFIYCMQFLSEDFYDEDLKDIEIFYKGATYLQRQKGISLCQQDKSGMSVLSWLLDCKYFKKEKGQLVTWLIKNGAEHRIGFINSMICITTNLDFGQKFLQGMLKHINQREKVINTFTGMPLQSINSGMFRNHDVSPVLNKLKQFALQSLD